jgi:hypothetical protein
MAGLSIRISGDAPNGHTQLTEACGSGYLMQVWGATGRVWHASKAQCGASPRGDGAGGRKRAREAKTCGHLIGSSA